MPSANAYVYAGDDPVNAVDPSGRDATSEAVCILNIVLAALGGIGGIVGVITSALGLGIAVDAGAIAVAALGLAGSLIVLLTADVGALLLLFTCGVTVDQLGQVGLDLAQLLVDNLH